MVTLANGKDVTEPRYVVVGPYCWGSALTVEAAYRRARSQLGFVKRKAAASDFSVYAVQGPLELFDLINGVELRAPELQKLGSVAEYRKL